MDGPDLHAVIDERIELPDLLRRKRQHAARTGEVFVGVYQLLG
jgi:thiamine kinase-like enzyme